MALGSPEQPSTSTVHPNTMHRADSTRSNASSRSVRASGDSKQQEDLINALEAEEERLVNTLTRKLEKLRAEKAELENVLEAESESLVLRLQRQLSLLMQQQQQSTQPSGSMTSTAPNASTAPNSPSTSMAPNLNVLIHNPHPLNPSPTTLIEVLKTENSNLRNRLVDTEREFIKTSRQNEIFRSELIALRQRLGMSIDDLIGAAPSAEESYPSARAARRRSRGTSTSGNGIPIPGLSGTENPRRSHHAPSYSSSSAQLSFASSTPMTPSSMTGESAHLISASLGTSLTTPSTSYPGLPVPHSTPAASPANGRLIDHAAAHSRASIESIHGPTGSSSQVVIDPSAPTSTSQTSSDLESDRLPASLPSPSRIEHCNGNPSNPAHAGGHAGRVAETGILRSGHRTGINMSHSPPRTSGVPPGGPENRLQFPPSSK